MFLVNEVLANTTATPDLKASIVNLVPFILIILAFYFLLIKPERKKQQEHKNFVNNVEINTKVIVAGGIIGKVVKVNDKDNSLLISISQDVNIKVVKDSIHPFIEENKANTDKKK